MKETKSCPRCNFRTVESSHVCARCGLNYDKLKVATNSEAKVAYSQGEKDRVVYTNRLPKDVNFKSLLLFTIFLGWAGGHHLYVGKRGAGITALIVGVLSILTTSIIVAMQQSFTVSTTISNVALYCGGIFGIMVILSIVDIIKVCFGRYKVPVALPYKVVK